MKTTNLLLAAVLALGSAGVFAQADHSQHAAAASASTSAMVMTSGEVRKVDLDQGKVTLKHEAISNLDMPAMTMVFRVEKAEQLKNLKPGDKVSFHAQSTGGAMVVTHIEATK